MGVLNKFFPRLPSDDIRACVLIGLLGYPCWTARFRLDFSAEGLYLGSALRYALGALLELRLLNVVLQVANCSIVT